MNPEERIRLEVLGLSLSQTQSKACALILEQVGGPYRIPIVIGPSEAQSIAMSMAHMTPPRPLTHDLFVSVSHAFGIQLREVFIYKFEDGVFFSEMQLSDGERTIVMDARTSDAVAIATRTKAPIYTTREIIEETGFLMEGKQGGSESESTIAGDSDIDYGHGIDEAARGTDIKEPKLENYSIEELEKTLKKLMEQEKYEEAAEVSMILNRKKGEAGKK